MKTLIGKLLALLALTLPAQLIAQVTFYEHDGFAGQALSTDRAIDNFASRGFNDRVSSLVVSRGSWELCEDAGYGGRCVVLRAGSYSSLHSLGFNDRVSSARPVGGPGGPAGAAGAGYGAPRISLYEHDGLTGQALVTDRDVENFAERGFNDRASSIAVERGQWEICEDAYFGGRCAVLGPGRYGSLRAMDMNDRISSVRVLAVDPRGSPGYSRADDERYDRPPPPPDYRYRRQRDERLFEADVTSVRAVVQPGGQRCWVEREQVAQDGSDVNVPGAVVGAVIGGILGHQIGDGSGRDIATVGGAVVGGVLGANVGRDRSGRQVVTRDVQRCAESPGRARPDYWDVTYQFRGQEHHVQMTRPPGRTITVNRRGEPREE